MRLLRGDLEVTRDELGIKIARGIRAVGMVDEDEVRWLMAVALPAVLSGKRPEKEGGSA